MTSESTEAKTTEAGGQLPSSSSFSHRVALGVVSNSQRSTDLQRARIDIDNPRQSVHDDSRKLVDPATSEPRPRLGHLEVSPDLEARIARYKNALSTTTSVGMNTDDERSVACISGNVAAKQTAIAAHFDISDSPLNSTDKSNLSDKSYSRGVKSRVDEFEQRISSNRSNRETNNSDRQKYPRKPGTSRSAPHYRDGGDINHECNNEADVEHFDITDDHQKGPQFSFKRLKTIRWKTSRSTRTPTAGMKVTTRDSYSDAGEYCDPTRPQSLNTASSGRKLMSRSLSTNSQLSTNPPMPWPMSDGALSVSEAEENFLEIRSSIMNQKMHIAVAKRIQGLEYLTSNHHIYGATPLPDLLSSLLDDVLRLTAHKNLYINRPELKGPEEAKERVLFEKDVSMHLQIILLRFPEFYLFYKRIVANPNMRSLTDDEEASTRSGTASSRSLYAMSGALGRAFKTSKKGIHKGLAVGFSVGAAGMAAGVDLYQNSGTKESASSPNFTDSKLEGEAKSRSSSNKGQRSSNKDKKKRKDVKTPGKSSDSMGMKKKPVTTID